MASDLMTRAIFLNFLYEHKNEKEGYFAVAHLMRYAVNATQNYPRARKNADILVYSGLATSIQASKTLKIYKITAKGEKEAPKYLDLVMNLAPDEYEKARKSRKELTPF